MLKFLLLTLLVVGDGHVEGSKILFFIGGIASYSHRTSIQPLVNKLAERGHQVTFLSPQPIPKNQHPDVQNFFPVDLDKIYQKFLEDAGVTALKKRVESPNVNEVVSHVRRFFGDSHQMCQDLMESQSLRDWLDKEKAFDLAIIDAGMNTCAFGLAYYMKAKVIQYQSLSAISMWDHTFYGIPSEINWVPGLMSFSYGGQLTFLDKLSNSLFIPTFSYLYQHYHLPEIEKILKSSYLSPHLQDMPSLEKIIRNTSLLFVNQHYSDHYPRSYPPFVVPVGGMVLQDAPSRGQGKLPKKMEDFIQNRNGTDAGFVYISFGSLIKISTMPQRLFKIFSDVLSSMDMRFLFKWEGKVPENPPENVLFHSWFPQDQVLAHPKIRAFIMQGGQVSLQQAIFNGVPMLIFPIIGDQDINAKRIELMGNGLSLELAQLTRTKLKKAIEELLNDPSYSQVAKRFSVASRHRPLSALDTAVWWAEHVIDNDVSYLKPLSGDQNMWTQWGVDVWAFLFIFIGGLILFNLCLCNYCCCRKRKDSGRVNFSRSSVRTNEKLKDN